MNDFIIIGAGPSGLYCSYLLSPQYTVLVLEANDYIGGRMQQTQFHGVTVQLGAGVIRKSDKDILKLVKVLGLEVNNFTSSSKVAIEGYDKKWYNENLCKLKWKKNKSMNEILNEHFKTSEEKKTFVDSGMYTDYLKADSYMTIKYYPIGDMYKKASSLCAIKGGYYKLVTALAKSQKGKIILKSKVSTVIKENNGTVCVVTSDNKKFYAKHVICCIDLNGLKHIQFIPKVKSVEYLKKVIGINNFARLYTYHSNVDLDNSIIVSSFLKNVIPISDKVVMSGYCDNNNAKKLKKYIEENRDLTNLINKSIKGFGSLSEVKDVLFQYWNVGTHYYKPGYVYKNDFFIEDNISIVGEMVAEDQGWTNGAIKSINNWYNAMFNQS